MTVWDSDPANSRVPYDEVDEFDYDLVDVPGSNPRLLTIDGIRPDNKTRSVIKQIKQTYHAYDICRKLMMLTVTFYRVFASFVVK